MIGLRRTMAIVALSLASLPASAEMRGHGGPIKAIIVSPDGRTAVTGSFDTTVIVWDLEAETAVSVRKAHEAPVNAVVPAGRGFATASDDGRVAIWSLEHADPLTIVGDRDAPAVGLLVEGMIAIHADRTLRSMGRITATFAEAPIAIVATPEGPVVATADHKLRWVASQRIIDLPSNANVLAAAPDGEIVAGGADGALVLLSANGTSLRRIEVQDMPITSLALSADGRLVAVAGLRGSVRILDRATSREVSTLVGPGLPVWSLAFHPDGRTILTGGADRMLRKWDVRTGQPMAPANAPKPDFTSRAMTERGAQVFRACEACHTVTPDGGNRAGPTLHGVFGRRIGAVADYSYSAGFAQKDIVWTEETIARLFREGPSVVTPGTKMPEQRITDEEDLRNLVDWLAKVTR
jgi:cytochrome c